MKRIYTFLLCVFVMITSLVMMHQQYKLVELEYKINTNMNQTEQKQIDFENSFSYDCKNWTNVIYSNFKTCFLCEKTYVFETIRLNDSEFDEQWGLYGRYNFFPSRWYTYERICEEANVVIRK